MNIKKNNEYDKVINDTRNEYLSWINDREKVRLGIKKLLWEQRLKVDNIFDRHYEDTM